MRKSWIFLLILLLLIALNIERLGRHFYPFHYRETLFHYGQQYGIDPYLLAAIVKTESNFNSQARSPKGALGLMQIMPDTGYWIAEQIGEKKFKPHLLYDPEINVKFGAWYLSYLKREFNNDPILALAAYNGGKGNVYQWLKNARWTGKSRNLDQIPFPETRQYIRKVLWTYKVYDYLYRN